MTSPKFKTSEMRFLDELFESAGGYVLDFSNKTFSEFFEDELELDIYDPRWSLDGESKAKRLRFFLKNNPPAVVVRTLLALWDYRQKLRKRQQLEETVIDAEVEFGEIVRKFGGHFQSTKRPASNDEVHANIPSDIAVFLRDELVTVSSLDPQPRGFAFERFLHKLFDAYDLSARASFRLVGEQIDGSFQLEGETYLLEAKWTNEQTGSADLRSFNSKVEDKAAWSRGLFISNSGFSRDGLKSFGKGKSIVCMDGYDLWYMLDNALFFPEIVSRKVRRAAETGSPLVQVRDLFPVK